MLKLQIKGETSSFTIHTSNEADESPVVIVIGRELRRMSRLLIFLIARYTIVGSTRAEHVLAGGYQIVSASPPPPQKMIAWVSKNLANQSVKLLTLRPSFAHRKLMELGPVQSS